jgi:hypothetical protein
MEELKSVGNDGVIDGFEVLEDFTAKYNTQTLERVDAEKLDKEWKKVYEEGLVKCSEDGDENVELHFKKGDRVYFEAFDWSKDLVFAIIRDFKDKVEILS